MYIGGFIIREHMRMFNGCRISRYTSTKGKWANFSSMLRDFSFTFCYFFSGADTDACFLVNIFGWIVDDGGCRIILVFFFYQSTVFHLLLVAHWKENTVFLLNVKETTERTNEWISFFILMVPIVLVVDSVYMWNVYFIFYFLLFF